MQLYASRRPLEGSDDGRWERGVEGVDGGSHAMAFSRRKAELGLQEHH